MSKAGANNPEKQIEKLLAEVDDVVQIDDIGKEARLSDAKNTLTSIQADIIGLRRVLVQHHNPDIPIQELNNQPLGQAIREKLQQAKRLSAYVEELEQLPDDPSDDDTQDANGHEGLRAVEEDARLDNDDSVSN